MIARRLTILILAGASLFGCGHEPPHSDYYMVAFLPGTPAPSDEGETGLDNAVREAGRHTPRFIAVSGSVPSAGAAPVLAQQRLDAITHAFVTEGVNPGLIRTELRPMPDEDYQRRKDSFTIQLEYGLMSKIE